MAGQHAPIVPPRVAGVPQRATDGAPGPGKPDDGACRAAARLGVESRLHRLALNEVTLAAPAVGAHPVHQRLGSEQRQRFR
jgi:hypothetical protein